MLDWHNININNKFGWKKYERGKVKKESRVYSINRGTISKINPLFVGGFPQQTKQEKK